MSTSTPTVNYPALEAAIAASDWKKVEQWFADWVKIPTTPAERGATLVELAYIFTKLETEMNKDYIEHLEEAIEMGKILKEQGAAVDKAIKITKVRKAIKDL